PKSMVSKDAADEITSLDAMLELGSDDEPINVLVGYNLGNLTWSSDVALAKFVEWSEIANDPDRGEVAQRKLDPTHAKSLAAFMLKGLVNAAIIKRRLQDKDVPESFFDIQNKLGTKPYCALQPIVANIRSIDPNKPSIRADRATTSRGETVGFKVFMPRSYRWWVVDGQHRRFGAEMVLDWLKEVTRNGKYPARGSIVDLRGDVSPEEMTVWLEAYECARNFATVKIEFHLGLDTDQERQLFHDLNNLGKKINVSQATEFDQGNPINRFVRETIEDELGVTATDREIKDWNKDSGAILTKDLAAINAIAFLNRTNVRSATPAVVNERSAVIEGLWTAIVSLPYFGQPGAKLQTVAAQPVVLKALAKITFDLNFSNRRPVNGGDIYEDMLSHLEDIDFSHENPMWRFYHLSARDRENFGVSGLAEYLPNRGVDTAASNRDIGAYQSGVMRFGAKHNDIFPILADMMRWKLQLPNRHAGDMGLEEAGGA
ncbi:DNA sulfur modification protein DndB, partial [Aurantimonas sp. NFXS3]|uniref:DNA sulfur modification protein DndB n=1 Tax=Aurantimonas sp. NFXS3 TaxID=2818434 RepID=UPI003B8E20A2